MAGSKKKRHQAKLAQRALKTPWYTIDEMATEDVAIDSPEEEMSHVDHFIDRRFGEETYARFVLNYFRMPATLQIDFKRYMEKYKLFCMYQGNPYRVTGASRLGDVWLTSNFDQDTGYQLRVNVDECSLWADEPPVMPEVDEKQIELELK